MNIVYLSEDIDILKNIVSIFLNQFLLTILSNTSNIVKKVT